MPTQFNPPKDVLSSRTCQEIASFLVSSLQLLNVPNKQLRVSHHFLKLNLEDHSIFEGLDEPVRAKVKRSSCFVELSILLPCIRSISQRHCKLREMSFDNILDLAQCEAFFRRCTISKEGLK